MSEFTQEGKAPSVVESPSVFWKSLQPWIRLAIVLAGLLIGTLLFILPFSPLAGVAGFVLLTASGTAGIALKIAICALFVILIALTVGTPWALFQIIFWIARTVATTKKIETPKDFFIRK